MGTRGSDLLQTEDRLQNAVEGKKKLQSLLYVVKYIQAAKDHHLQSF